MLLVQTGNAHAGKLGGGSQFLQSNVCCENVLTCSLRCNLTSSFGQLLFDITVVRGTMGSLWWYKKVLPQLRTNEGGDLLVGRSNVEFVCESAIDVGVGVEVDLNVDVVVDVDDPLNVAVGDDALVDVDVSVDTSVAVNVDVDIDVDVDVDRDVPVCAGTDVDVDIPVDVDTFVDVLVDCVCDVDEDGGADVLGM